MDPTATYLEMYISMHVGDHFAAREHAKSLKEWLDKGGFYPPAYSKIEVENYLLNVLRRTEYTKYL